MTASVQQGHCASDRGAICRREHRWPFARRGHRRYKADIWDEIITALALIEAAIPGVIRTKQTTAGSSKNPIRPVGRTTRRGDETSRFYTIRLKVILDERVRYLYLLTHKFVLKKSPRCNCLRICTGCIHSCYICIWMSLIHFALIVLPPESVMVFFILYICFVPAI